MCAQDPFPLMVRLSNHVRRTDRRSPPPVAPAIG